MPQKPPIALLAALTAGANLPLPARADDAQKVEITGRHYETGLGISDAASQGVVRAELLESRPLLRPGEVLETVPGLVVTQHSGDGKANQYFLRGFNLDHGTDFATTVDGLPVNMPTNAHGQGYSDLNFLIPELVDRIEYRKGPYFASHGDFSAAGSADIVYRHTLQAPFAQVGLGQRGYRRAVAGASGELSPGVNLLGVVESMANDGPWELPEGLHRSNAVLTLSGGSTTRGWHVSLMGYNAHWHSTDQVPQRLIDAGSTQGRPFTRFSAIDPTDAGRTSRNSVSGRWVDSDASGRTELRGYAMHYSLALFSNFTYFLNDPVNGDQFSQQESRDVYGLSASRTLSHRLFGVDARSELGAQLRHDRIRVGLFDTMARQTTGTTRDDKVRETLASLYAQSAIEWSPTLRALVGLRVDRLHTSVDSLTQPLNSGAASQTLASPKIALVFGPWAKTEFFVDAGQGFHSNDARGTTARVDPKDPTVALDRVPPLVKARGYELGVRTEAVAGLQSSLSLWRLDFASELTYAGDDGTTSPNGASRRFGLEWNNHWVARPWLLFDLDLAWNHARFNSDQSDDITVGRYVPNSVDRVATGGVTLRDLGPWTVNVTERYIGLGALTADGGVRSSASAIANLRVSRRFGPKAELSLDALNLFDRRYNDIEYYYATRLPGEPLAGVNDKVVHPGEPRTLRLALKFTL